MLNNTGLLYDIGDSEPARLFDVVGPGLARDQDHRQCRLSAPKAPQEFNSTHFRHVDVEKYSVRSLLAQKPEPLLRIIDDRHLVALAPHGLREQLRHDYFIIDNQDPHRSLLAPRRRTIGDRSFSSDSMP